MIRIQPCEDLRGKKIFQAVKKAKQKIKKILKSKQLKTWNLIELSNYLLVMEYVSAWLEPSVFTPIAQHNYPLLSHSLLKCSGFNKKWYGQSAYKSEIIEATYRAMLENLNIDFAIVIKLRKLVVLITIYYCLVKVFEFRTIHFICHLFLWLLYSPLLII